MYQAIPFRSWRPLHNPSTHLTPLPLITHSHCDKKRNNHSPKKGKEDMVFNMVSENAVIVIGRRGCCMTHVMKLLLQGLGVNPAMHELEEKDEPSVAMELEEAIQKDGKENGKVQFPAVFIGGKFFGGLDRLMATHVSGELVPLLKQAGALWL